MASKYASQINNMTHSLERLEGLLGDLPEVRRDLGALRSEVSALAAKIDVLYDGCPYREDIARAANNVKRVERLESKLEGDIRSLDKSQMEDRLRVLRLVFQIVVLLAGTGIGVDKLISLFR